MIGWRVAVASALVLDGTERSPPRENVQGYGNL
jgi:hypothetical protein